MTAQPNHSPAFSARSLIHGQGHPSQLRRLSQPWRLETAGRAFGVRRAAPTDLPAVMAALVRSSARTRWQWRGARGGAVPSIAEMASWLQRPHSLVVIGQSTDRTAKVSHRIVALAGLDEVTCAGHAAAYALGADVLVADPWQGQGIGTALAKHLAAATWLLGRRELTASAAVEQESGERLLASLGELTTRHHPHGEHRARQLGPDSLSGLGPLRSAWLA